MSHNKMPRWLSEGISVYEERQADPTWGQSINPLYRKMLLGDDLTPVATWAMQSGLSPSRFQHLFTEQIGVPFRRYRSWNRMRQAIREILRGHNFTTAAHATGFTDSAHFSHEFRKTFGAPATIGLHRLARLQL